MAVTDDERRRVAERLRRLNAPSLIALMSILDVGGRDMCARLADLIEPALTSSDTTATHTDTTATCDMSQSRRDTVACDLTERGIDSIYDWCFDRIEGADGAEDFLYCSIMSAIEEYRHPERVTARTARPVDRDALLALASSMSVRHSWLSATDAERGKAIARRIREACGEVAS